MNQKTSNTTLMSKPDNLIYILDDSKIITEIMKRVISTIPDVKVLAFRNANSFMDNFSSELPNLVFLDFYLDSENKNEANGEEIFKIIKKKHPEIPVVMITGINNPEKLTHFRKIGFSEVINKDEPEIFNNIINCVQKFVA